MIYLSKKKLLNIQDKIKSGRQGLHVSAKSNGSTLISFLIIYFDIDIHKINKTGIQTMSLKNISTSKLCSIICLLSTSRCKTSVICPKSVILLHFWHLMNQPKSTNPFSRLLILILFKINARSNSRSRLSYSNSPLTKLN